MKYNRKSFLKTLGATSLGLLGASALPAKSVNQNPKANTLTFGLASYSVRKFSLDETIAMCQRLGLKKLCLKSMHLPLDSSPQALKEAAKKVKDGGLDLYGAGVIYMKSEAEVEQAFKYADGAGMKVIVGVPNPEFLPLVDKLVKKYDITLAIHNHGPGDKVYPSPDDVYEKIKNFDKRIGLCMDIGHTERIEQNCSKKARQYADRLYDIHLKDVDQIGAPGKSVEFGHGIIDIPAFLKTLVDINYQGVVSMEYEKDADDPLPGMAESIGYARGVMDSMS